MSENPVFVVSEVWVKSGTMELLKQYRRQVHELLEQYQPEYIFSSHPTDWLYGGEGEALPTGTEVMKLKCEQDARAVIEILNSDSLKILEDQVFDRVRCYLSQVEAPQGAF